ncbi:MAG: triose-phosphate isomerase [Treponema sp.]
MEGYYIAANWKMNLRKEEAVELARKIKEGIKSNKNKCMIAPSFPFLQSVGEVLKDSSIILGAQNMGLEDVGAYTGDVSPLQLLDVGVKVVILGHSERRHIFKEDDQMINKKVLLALKHGLEVILCVGETLQEREGGKAQNICENQVKEGLKGVTATDMKKISIAYEPVWAIGTGKSASPKDADDMHAFIRSTIKVLYDEKIGNELIIQYGGSMKEENAEDLLKMPNINGGLIGGASLKAESFTKIASI